VLLRDLRFSFVRGCRLTCVRFEPRLVLNLPDIPHCLRTAGSQPAAVYSASVAPSMEMPMVHGYTNKRNRAHQAKRKLSAVQVAVLTGVLRGNSLLIHNTRHGSRSALRAEWVARPARHSAENFSSLLRCWVSDILNCWDASKCDLALPASCWSAANVT